MAEESEETLVKSLRNSGIRLPVETSSLGDLETSDLVSICVQSLSLIGGDTASFRSSLSESSSSSTNSTSVADKFKLCTEIASAIKRIGYLGDISFHQFLYPSEEESSKLIRFLLEKISESSEIKSLKSFSDKRRDDFKSYLEDWIDEEVSESDGDLVRGKMIKNRKDSSGDHSSYKIEKSDDSMKIEAKSSDLCVTSEVSESKDNIFRGEMVKHGNDSSVAYNKDLELEILEQELVLLETAVELAFDDQTTLDIRLEQLKEKVENKKHSLQELNSQWEATIKLLEEEKKALQKSLYENRPETKEKFERLKEIELETQTISSQVEKRNYELSRVSEELEKRPKGEKSRKSHIDRVKEITINSRKQDSDIERILKDTRELQLESNAIQERLHRTYAIVDEMVFREAKKDQVGRQAYRLVTSIHESFEQIAEKILATDQVRREVAEREKKLGSIASRGLNLGKLQADLNAIRTENENLEKGFGVTVEKSNPL